MENFQVYRDIQPEPEAIIYIGVVGLSVQENQHLSADLWNWWLCRNG